MNATSSSTQPTQTQTPPPLKPGVQTSEFWMVLASVLVAALFDYLGKLPPPYFTVIVMVLPIVFVGLRTWAKNHHASVFVEFVAALAEAGEARAKTLPAPTASSQLPAPPSATGGFITREMAMLLAIAAAVTLVLTACASTTLYGANGKPRLRTQADLVDVRLTPDGGFHAAQVNHSTPTRAGGEASSKVLGGLSTLTTSAGAAFVTKGAVK